MQASYWRYPDPHYLIYHIGCMSRPDLHRSGIVMAFGHLTGSNGCPWYMDSRIWPFVRSRHLALYMARPPHHSSSFVCEFSEQLHTFSRPPPPTYSFVFTPGLCRLDIGRYLALGHEYACRGLYFACRPSTGTAPIMTRYIQKPHHACDLVI